MQCPANEAEESNMFGRLEDIENGSCLYAMDTCEYVLHHSDPRIYSTDIQFQHQSTGGLPVPCCKTLVNNMSTIKPSTSMTYVACETKLHMYIHL